MSKITNEQLIAHITPKLARIKSDARVNDNVIKMECVSSTEPEWFTVGNIYDAEPRGADICICGDNLVSDLDIDDWYEMSFRADGMWFLIGFQQSILFRPVRLEKPKLIEVKISYA